MKIPKFIVLEGVEASGKSTQLQLAEQFGHAAAERWRAELAAERAEQDGGS